MRTKVASFFIFSKSFQTKKIKALRPKMTKIASRGGSCLKERKLKNKTNQFLNAQQREGDIFHDQSSFVLWTVFFSFLFFFLTMAPQVLEKKIALLFTYRKIVIIFKSVELEHTPSSFPQSKR